MRYFVLALALSLISLSFVIPDSYAGAPRGDPAEIVSDKEYYLPGDEVNLEIHFLRQWGSSVELSVIEGLNTGNRIFFATKQIENFSQPVKFSFIIPEDSEFHRHLVVATIVGEGNYDNITTDYVPSLILYTKEGADKAVISDFFIEFGSASAQVKPGQSVPVKFEIIDGSGEPIPNVRAHIGICDESLKEAPNWIAVLPGHRYGIKNSESYSGCIFLQRNIIPDSGGMFDFGIEIPNNAPKGKYILNIWSEQSYPFGENLEKSLEIEISGKPVNPEEPAIIMIVDKEIDYRDTPEMLMDDEYLTYGQKMKFYGYQMAKPGGDIIGNPQNIPERYKDDCCIGEIPAIPDVNIHVTIVGPNNQLVFDGQTNGGKDGDFEYLAFELTESLQPGIYEIYYDITKNGNYVQHRGSNNPDIFYLVNLDKFSVDYEDQSFDVYFQGIDVTATDIMFDQQSKSIVFDVEKTEGVFYNNYFLPRQGTGFGISCPLIHIEQPLLHGYFTTTFNGLETGTCNAVFGKSSLVAGPIDDDGTLEIVGTHVIPEFGTLAILLLSLAIIPIVLASRKTQFWVFR